MQEKIRVEISLTAGPDAPDQLAADRPAGVALAAQVARALNAFAATPPGRAALDRLALARVEARAAGLADI